METVEDITIEESKDSRSCLRICVTNPSIREDTLSKYVIYTVQGLDNQGDFERVRRYTDFVKLRMLLIENWPTCYVPPIPPKQVIGNFASQFIESRRKMLNHFVSKISELSYLYHAEEFQQFIRGPEDYEKAASLKQSICSIEPKFTSNFEEFNQEEVSDQRIQTIAGFEKFAKSNFVSLKEFKETVKTVKLQYEQFRYLMNGFSKKFTEVESQYLNYFGTVNIFTPLSAEAQENPFETLYEWIKFEIVDLKSMLQVVEHRYFLDNEKYKAECKVSEYNKRINKLQSGKSSIKQMLSTKSKEQNISSTEAKLAQKEKEIKAFSMVIRIALNRLGAYELPKFQEKKTKEYKTMMQQFSSLLQSEFQTFNHSAEESLKKSQS